MVKNQLIILDHMIVGASESSSGPSLLGDRPRDDNMDGSRPPPLLDHPMDRQPRNHWNGSQRGPDNWNNHGNQERNDFDRRGGGNRDFNPNIRGSGPPPVVKEQHKDFTVGPKIDFTQFGKSAGGPPSGPDSGNDFGGNRPHRPEFSNMQARGPRPGGFQQPPNFNGPRMDFRGPRPGFSGPRGPPPRGGNPGAWPGANNNSAPRGNWNGPRGRGGHDNQYRPY